MKKVSIKQLIEFRKKSEKGKKLFVQNLKSPKIENPSEGGGDFWVSGLSAVFNSYKDGNTERTDEKIKILNEKINNTKLRIIKNMYRRNINILQIYKNLDIAKYRPSLELSFLKKSSGNPVLTIDGLEFQTKPSHIFTYGTLKSRKVGAIWFTAKLGGYSDEELGMFCEMLQRFLMHNYSTKYELESDYCVSIDMFTGKAINYSQIESGAVSSVFVSTIEEIIRLL